MVDGVFHRATPLASPTPLGQGLEAVKLDEQPPLWPYVASVKAWYTEQVVALHAVRSLKHWKNLYTLAGIRTVWQVRNDLLRLVGEPAQPLPQPTDDWSLREVSEMIPTGWHDWSLHEAEMIPTGWRRDLSLRSVADFLGTGHSLSALRDA
jgi:hypothetical protein